ncbi:hypothetical protein HDU97_001394 [Phlyctochytrium planicorne]|nr:hypothetical protein HDU97_001394 [Phlyctochytrium planicorne]
MEDDGFTLVTKTKSKRTKPSSSTPTSPSPSASFIPKCKPFQGTAALSSHASPESHHGQQSLDAVSSQKFNYVAKSSKKSNRASRGDDRAGLEKVVALVEDRIAHMRSSKFFADIKAIIENNSKHLHPTRFLQCVAYGLGPIHSSSIARDQLSLLLLFKEYWNFTVESYDPVYNELDVQVLNHFSVSIIPINEMGRRKITTPTLFYMPHCGHSLYANVIASNLSTSLNDIIIIGNSFEAYHTMPKSSTHSALLERISLLDSDKRKEPSKFLTEVPFPTTFTDKTVFNNTSLHLFDVGNVDKDVWVGLGELAEAEKEIEDSEVL